jgi:type I restriction enzyme M protein
VRVLWATRQYFTPRALIDAIVTVIDPEPRETVHDPACGTGGFLLAAWEHMRKKPTAQNVEVYTAMRSRFSGVDIVPEVVRLCAMNLYLHDIADRESPIEARDALLGAGGQTFDLILTNPPFGKKQSYRVVRDDGEIDTEREDYDRQDFFVTTSNKQLNFLQHIMTVLAENGRAAVVMPDNVLFEGRRRRDDPPPSIAQFRFPHSREAADRHFLQAGRQSERFVL